MSRPIRFAIAVAIGLVVFRPFPRALSDPAVAQISPTRPVPSAVVSTVERAQGLLTDRLMSVQTLD
ncbi:MAG: hypothetical protein KDA84_09625 [Planctomycetaceae bacterium]|nr:hypothetical protein [Planctomycetaceae bacterium]